MAETIHQSRLEESLDSYSAADLEQWILLRKSADLGWRREDLNYTRIRKIEDPVFGGMFLIPGGRWLLVGGRRGSMLAYDLNASPITKTALIPEDLDKQFIDFIAIDRLETPGQNFTFNMAVSPRLPTGKLFGLCVTLYLTGVS